MKKSTLRRLSDLRDAPLNPRTITSEALAGLKESARAFGDLSGIVYNSRTRRLVAGHQRARALREAGARDLGRDEGGLFVEHPETRERFRVRVVDWDEAREAAANLAANSPLLQGEFTAAALDLAAQALGPLPELGQALRLHDLAALLAPRAAAEAPEDLAPPPEVAPREVTVRVGEAYALGPHRLACADSTDPAVLAALAGEDRASLVHTDPPYGVSYEAPSGKHSPISGDDLRRRDLVHLVAGALRAAASVVEATAAWYVWHAEATRTEFLEALGRAGLEVRDVVVWIKPSAGLGANAYRRAHEPCLYAARAGETPNFYGGRTPTSTWRLSSSPPSGLPVSLGTGLVLQAEDGTEAFLSPRVPKKGRPRVVRLAQGPVEVEVRAGAATAWEVARDRDYEHPTQKPLELAARAIAHSTLPGQAVVDPFLGGGTTLLAAHRSSRRCWGVELDPSHAQTCLDRWARETGERPELMGASIVRSRRSRRRGA